MARISRVKPLPVSFYDAKNDAVKTGKETVITVSTLSSQASKKSSKASIGKSPNHPDIYKIEGLPSVICLHQSVM